MSEPSGWIDEHGVQWDWDAVTERFVPRRKITPRPFIACTKTWEVECSECGLFDGQSSKAEAMRVARRHRDEDHDGNASVGGGFVTNERTHRGA